MAEVLEVPVNHFLGDGNKAVEDWILHDPPMRVPYFDVFGHKVWGATAMVLAEFAAIVSDAAAKGSPIPRAVRTRARVKA